MTTNKERADEMKDTFDLSFYGRDVIRHHLDEACREAVEEKCAGCPVAREDAVQEYIKHNRPEAVAALRAAAEASCVCQRLSKNLFGTSHDCPVHGPHASRPKAEDALKAATRIATMMGCSKPEEWNDFIAGCNDLLNGWRDTAAARAITGEVA